MSIKSLKDLKADLWVFDCDGVIYANAKGAEREVVRSMIRFIASRYGCSMDRASVIRSELLKKHNVPHSIMALVREGFNEQEVLRETYFAISLEELGIFPSLEIQELMSSLHGIKVMLTNNHEGYARSVLNQIGILDHFSAIFGVNKLGLIQKPDVLAFQFVQDSISINENVVFVDDEMKNVIAATEFGWTAVLIESNKEGYKGLWLPRLC